MFENWAGEPLIAMEAIPPSGSDRQYFRLRGIKNSVMGAYNPSLAENLAFFEFTRHFFKKGLPVPELYVVSEDKLCYLQQDLGDTILLSKLNSERQGDDFPKNMIPYYRKAVELLARFQIKGGEGLNYQLAHPRADFDKQSMLWDLQYFKYFFFKARKNSFR